MKNLTQDKWLTLVIWLALLLALLYTSAHSVTAITGSNFNWLLQYIQLSASTGREISIGSPLVALISIVLALAVIGLLYNVWIKFAELTNELVIGYAESSRVNADENIFTYLLNFSLDPTCSEAEAIEENGLNNTLDEENTTQVSDVIRFLAYTWIALLLLSPVFSSILATFFR